MNTSSSLIENLFFISVLCCLLRHQNVQLRVSIKKNEWYIIWTFTKKNTDNDFLMFTYPCGQKTKLKKITMAKVGGHFPLDMQTCYASL